MRTRTTRGILLAGLALAGLAGHAHAQDSVKATGAKKPVPAASKAKPKAVADDAKSKDSAAKSEAVRSVPKWQAFGAGEQPETLEETFFRLAQDFVSTSEIGVRRLGRVPLWPRGNLKLGSFRVLPYLRQGVEWETNVYRRPITDRISDQELDPGREHGWAWVTNGGLLADTMLMGGRLSLAASVDGQWEVRDTRDQPDTRETSAQVGASYRWPSGIRASVGAVYERFEDPIEIQQTSEFKRTNWRGFWNVDFDRDIFFGSKVQFQVGMTARDTDTLDDRNIEGRADRTEVEYHAKASYPFWKQTTRIYGLARYRNEEREAKELNDGDVWGFDVGMEGDFPILGGETRGLRGSVSVGFDHAEYDDGTYSDNLGRRYERDDNDSDTSVAIRAALQYTLGPRTVIDLRALRTNQFSAFGNYQITDRVDLTAQHTIRPQLVGRIAAFGEHSDPSNSTPLKRVDRQEQGLNYDPQRNINRWGVGAGLRYTLTDWTDVDMSWDYERRNAPDDRGYSNHRVTLGVTFYLTAIKPSAQAPAVR